MNTSRTLLTTLAAMASFALWPNLDSARAQSSVDYGPVGPEFVVPPAEDCSTPKPVLIEPQGTWIQPAAPVEMVPIMPLPQSAGPRPGELTGQVFGAPEQLPAPATASSPLSNIAPGGAVSPQFGLPAGPEPVPGFANPMFIPAGDDQLAWEQIAEVVSDYFTIAREQQVRRSGDTWSEGRIETNYQNGASWLEPFRKDSVGTFNRWESTFQTIRRRAIVRVIPDPNGYLVEVVVDKELENLPHPERSSASLAAFPNITPLATRRAGGVNITSASPRWIPQGRDPALEARMLAEIHARLCGVTTASRPWLFP